MSFNRLLLNFKIRKDWLNVSYSPIRYIVISIMALVLIGLAIHIARDEEGLNKWVILFGMLGLDGLFVWIGWLTVSSQVIEVFNKW